MKHQPLIPFNVIILKLNLYAYLINIKFPFHLYFSSMY